MSVGILAQVLFVRRQNLNFCLLVVWFEHLNRDQRRSEVDSPRYLLSLFAEFYKCVKESLKNKYSN